MSIDLASLFSRVIERAAEKCGQVSPLLTAAAGGAQGDAVLVESLATQLLAVLGLNGNSGASPGQRIGNDVNQLTPGLELVERNRNLARALGACECWGELPDCKVCHGRGGSGWRLPQKPLFDLIVRPALQTVKEYRVAVQNNRGSRLSK